MSKKILKKLLIMIFIILSQPLFAGQNSTVFRRFGFFIGSNNGGSGNTVLEYAGSDAEEMAATMEDIGGIKSQDMLLLKNPKIDNIFRGFKIIQHEILLAKKDNVRIEFLLYYSGHSDETGLLINGKKLKYKNLRLFIKQAGAEVNIAILDSCSSGSFTRIKGGKMVAPFLMDESVKTKGHAFLTSSSADESAQESDTIGGSFFTHYLISALRGAADTSLDEKVTLNEAYSYASAETLGRTVNTIGGAQHPAYDINLTGSGDLVLTDLRASSAVFMIENDIQGRLFIRDSESRLTLELHKTRGIPATIALPPGAYSITLENGDTTARANVRLFKNNKTTLEMIDFQPVSKELTKVRGSGSGFDSDTQKRNTVVHKKTKITLTIESETSKSSNTLKRFSLNLFDFSKLVSGLQTSLMNVVLKSVNGIQVAAISNSTGGEIKGVQTAGIFNISGEKITGWQAAGVFNITDGAIQGGQAAGIFNLTNGDVSDFQGSGIFNFDMGNSEGFQGAGVFNFNMGNFEGFQGAGVFNFNMGNFEGFQGAGVINLTRGYFNGFQAAGVVSGATKTKGAQAGLVNISGDVNGVQMGLVNLGRNISGVQVGIVNINNDIHGIPIGLVNISLQGLHNLSSWSDTGGITYFGFQFGTRYLYTLLYGGFPFNNIHDELAVGLGSGFHIPVYPFYFDFDLSVKYISTVSSFITSKAVIITPYELPILFHPAFRISAGFPIFRSIAIFGGVLFDSRLTNTLNNSGFFKGKPITTLYRSISEYASSPWYDSGNELGIDIYAHWFLGIRL